MKITFNLHFTTLYDYYIYITYDLNVSGRAMTFHCAINLQITMLAICKYILNKQYDNSCFNLLVFCTHLVRKIVVILNIIILIY